VKRDFGFTNTRYRGLSKNLNHLNVLFASANYQSGPAPSPSWVTAWREPARKRQPGPQPPKHQATNSTSSHPGDPSGPTALRWPFEQRIPSQACSGRRTTVAATAAGSIVAG
jgi:hypothetical protein